MNKAKIIGILMVFLGSFFLLIVLFFLNFALLLLGDIGWIIYVVITIIAWVGGFGLKGKRIGGALALAAGFVIIIFYALFTLDPVAYAVFAPFSLFAPFLTIPYVTIEALLMIIGGLLIIASGPID